MPPRRTPEYHIAQILTDDDGIRPVREANEWALDKLGILYLYSQAFARACSRRARSWHFVDGLSGPGLNHIADGDRWALGSTLIALTKPEARFHSVLSIEADRQSVEALSQRTGSFADRSAVELGDCNEVLRDSMLSTIPRRAPVLVFLDPEGVEVAWETVRAISEHRIGGTKAEVLILFPTEGMNRMLPVTTEIEAHNETALDRFFPPGAAWRTIWQDRRVDLISPRQARSRYLRLYCEGFENLGYGSVQYRAVTRPRGSLIYHLVHATDHEGGERIMADVFENMYPNNPQMRLF